LRSTDKVIPTLGEDQDGNLYFTDLATGELFSIVESNASFLPVIFR